MALHPGIRSPANRWLRILAWTAAVVALVLLVTVLVVKMWINSHLRSPEFRRKLSERTAQHLQAHVEIPPISFETTEFFCDGLTATGAQDAKFSRLKVENVRGEFRLPTVWRMIFGDRKFEVENVDVQRAEVNFSDERLPLTFPKPEKKHKLTQVRRISVRELRVGWDGGSITGLGVAGVPVEGGWQVTGGGGRATARGLPPLDIVSLRVMHKQPALFVEEAKLRQAGGEISVTGEVTEKEKIDLQCKVTGVNVTPLLPEDWRARLHGRVAGEARVQAALRDGTSAAPVITGRAELQQGALETMPVMNMLADFTKTDRFRRLTLNQARGDFRVDDRGLHVSNLVVESERLISVKGGFTVVHGQIDGTFEVGITPGPLQWLPGSQEKVFTTMRDGYAWTTMRVNGPVRTPREDLSSRLVAAAQGAVVEKVESVATQAVGGAVDKMKKGAAGVLDLLFGN